MNRASSCGVAAFPWVLLATLVVGSGPAAWAAEAETASSPSVVRPVRGVHVHRVWSEPASLPDGESGLAVCAHVGAQGLRWRTLDLEVRLRTPDGKLVGVGPGAPEGYADEKGRFRMSARAPVFQDRSEWKDLRATFPFERVLGLPSEPPQRLIASLRASAAGFASHSEAEIMVPPGEAPNVRRAVRLLAVDALANSFAPEAPADRPESEGAGGIRARNGPGLAVWGYVEAVGLDQSKMSGRLSLRRKEDSSVAKGGEGGAPKPVERVEELEVAPDQAQAFFHFVPYSGLGLEPGRHDLILSYSARCEGLSATLEEEYRIEVPAVEDPPRAVPR